MSLTAPPKRRGRRLFDNLLRVWRGDDGVRAVDVDLPDDDLSHIREQIDACLALKGGEVSARARAAKLGQTYLDLSDEGRRRFLQLLADDYGHDPDALNQTLEAVRQATPEARAKAIRDLKKALDTKRVTLFRQFNALPEGVKFLVDMRAETLSLAREDARFAAVAADLKELFVDWFDIGFLDLRRITWDAPAALLEKLIAYEAVHEIRSWTDLKNRLDSDRRCFAFFHPRMPDEPLIFVEVALVRGIAGNIQELLDETAPALAPEDADTAIFYSISNAQAGLAGVSFGNFLIKQVVRELGKELPTLKRFATLSPVPGFRHWLREHLALKPADLLEADEVMQLAGAVEDEDAFSALQTLLDRPNWPEDDTVNAILSPILMRLCATYLISAKRKDGVRALDPVAHFHLSNGASLERLCWRGDISVNGDTQSAGIMVNYLYDLNEIDGNHQAYALEGRTVVANTVRRTAQL